MTAYFYVIGIYDENNFCLSWDETKEYAVMLDMRVVPVLYEGPWDEAKIKALWPRFSCFGNECEGYVVRTKKGFPHADFGLHVAKFVRKNHVQTSEHWMMQEVVPNRVVSDE